MSMKIVAILFLVLVVAALLALGALRLADARADRAEWRRLAALQPRAPQLYSAAMVAGLPEPARRYFGYTIRPGTPLLTVAEIDMRGQFSLGTRDKPGYQPMEARQILAAPVGFVWSMRTGGGLPVSGSDSGFWTRFRILGMEARQILAAPAGFVWSMRTGGGLPVSGSDSGSWTRFRILGLVPVARIGDTPDHARSAYGRQVAEAVFWTPAALLPGPGVVWEAVGPDKARVTVRHGALVQAVDVTVDAEGRPVEVSFQRWSDANPDRTFRLQPFGGLLSDFRDVGGFRLPHQVEAGNMFGTDAYFPFFLAEVTAVRFPAPGGAR